MNLKDKIDYCIYRMTKIQIDRVKRHNRKSPRKHYYEYTYGGVLFGICFSAILFSIVEIVGCLFALDVGYFNRTHLYGQWNYTRIFSAVICLFWTFYASKRKYMEQQEKHKKDTPEEQKRNGRAVLAFAIVSIVFFCATTYIATRVK